jgi:hypothetical protein
MKIKLCLLAIMLMSLNNVNLIGSEEKFLLIIKELSKDRPFMFYEAFIINTKSNDTIIKNLRMGSVTNSAYHLFENHFYYLELVWPGLGPGGKVLYLYKYQLHDEGSHILETKTIYKPNVSNNFRDIVDIGISFEYDKLSMFMELRRPEFDNEGRLFETYWQKIEVDLSTMETNESELIMVKDRHKMSID